MAEPRPAGLRLNVGTPFETGRDFAVAMDEADPLAESRAAFNFPPEQDGKSPVYFCGNSLGLQPKLAVRYVEEELEDWGRLAVEGHFHGRRPWLPYHRNATAGLSMLAGAQEAEVVAMNTLTVNLHLMMSTFYRPTKKRHRILIESTAFPSDRYAVASQIRLRGFDPGKALLEWRPRTDEVLHAQDMQALLDRHGHEIALLLLPGVQYYNGQVLDMQALCTAARDAGCAIGLDLAHAIGNLPLRLHDWGPDFAVWCSYKYLNGGPGAVGGAFVHAQHHGGDGSEALLGWWGHDEATRFEMRPEFRPARGAELWQLSNPPILSLAPVLASLEVFRDAGIERLREKSVRLTGYLDFLLHEALAARAEVITPPDARGCQLSLRILDGDPQAALRNLQAQNVFVDWREPDVIRAAPVPLYNSFLDVHDFVDRLRIALAT
jgi:kynureninase